MYSGWYTAVQLHVLKMVHEATADPLSYVHSCHVLREARQAYPAPAGLMRKVVVQSVLDYLLGLNE